LVRSEISLKFGEKHVTISITSDSARSATVLARNAWLGRLARSVAAAAKACLVRIVSHFHETQQRQAARAIARYRHLISDSDIAARPESKPKKQ
jgi:hypothetical protein